MTGNEPYYLVAAATAVGACLLLKAALSATVVLVSQSVVVHCSPQEVFDFLASEKSAYLQPLMYGIDWTVLNSLTSSSV